ncbi:46 kDa FK506-binding nuclear protein [Eumeta japonica]|uniref:FK506-binding protein n=1 Tax=Eumeta variegata TaxID=151549 RepID=A0A4C1Y621_EUMVA|nr:46 kDa FK506-binding nuclear protein [Eumeta japonica]
MFWGLIMEPNKRYTQTVEKPFHISQAAMDISTGDNDPCQVMVVVDQKNFLICTLQKGKAIQVPLDLYFKAGASVAFLTNGKCNVHLTGYLDPEFEDDESEGDDEAEEEEEEEAAPTLVMAKNKRKLDNSSDAVATKKAKKQANKKAAAEEDSDSSDEDVDNNLQKFLTDDMDSDENDESFKLNTSGEPDSDEEDSDDDEVEEEEDDDEEDDEKDEEEDSKAETTLDSSLDTGKDEEKKLSKSQKRRLKKKEKQQQAQVNGVDKAKKTEKPDAQQKKEKKQQEGKKQKDPEVKAGEKREKKTLTGGVYIEDLKVGDGPVAKSGKTVQVYYEGRLKQNNKMFDNCNKGAGFKFRLGSKEVITGWDVGVAGMKVGGKRKIVCPPAMAYGAKGSPPVIPPNSTLVFEVELKNVK